jgi:hypothetical protein
MHQNLLTSTKSSPDQARMAEEVPEGKVFAAFERFNEFLDLQKSLLALNLQEDPGAEVESKEFLTQQTLNVMVHLKFDLNPPLSHYIFYPSLLNTRSNLICSIPTSSN